VQLSQAHRPKSSAARRRIDSARLGRTGSPSFRRHPHQRCGGFPRASAHSRFALRLALGVRRAMRPTDVCFPTHSLRAPAPRAIPMPSSGFGELGVSRRLDSLRRALDQRARGVLFPVTGRLAALLAPLSHLSSARLRSSRRADRHRDAKTASATSLVKGVWRLRPGAPSVARWRAPHATRAIVSDPRETELVCRRSRDFAITIRLSAFLRPHLLAAGGLSTTYGSRVRARPRRRESMFG